jgi:hypothetical protein
MFGLTRRTNLETFQKPERRALDGKVVQLFPHGFLNLENLRVSQSGFFAGYVTRVLCPLSAFTSLVTVLQ